MRDGPKCSAEICEDFNTFASANEEATNTCSKVVCQTAQLVGIP